jgi:hypothetical protein
LCSKLQEGACFPPLAPGERRLGALRYYLLPAVDMTWENLRLAEENGIYLDPYRFDTLDYFFSLAECVTILEAA